MFLQRGSTAVALAGVAASVPRPFEVAQEPPAPEAGPSALEASWRRGSPRTWSPTFATSARKINLFIGERRIVLNDPGLAGAFRGAC
jgi:hypothetical protein